ncbi:MAG: T9SS type A sorting domain-containing protein [Saprospiraceae bacterium]
MPNNLVFDRCYIHGDPAAGSRRGIGMNGSYISVIDSYISDCKEDGADSQALGCWSTTGPLKIVNNYLEGAGENVIFGGSDPSIPNAVPSDIEIRYNHFFKPLSWMNEAWDIKNLLEFKNARRVLVEGNHFENNWPNAQSGFALLITPRNQNNTAPWSVDEDITIRLNIFDNIAQGINISGFDSPNVSQRTSRLLIQNNVWHVTNLGMGGDGRLFQVLNGPTDVIIDHNTGFCTNAYLVSDGNPKTDFFVFTNNIVTHANYGFIGSGTGTANTTLAMYFNPNWTVLKNADIGGSANGYPAGNYFPPNIAAVGFVNYAAGDYHLAPTSPYKNLGTDGKDLGADIDSIGIASIYNCEVQTGTKDLATAQLEMSLYPVPADALLHVHTNGTDNISGLIIIYDQMGRQVQRKVVNESEIVLDTSALLNGIYFIQFQIGGKVVIKKIVVQHKF